MSASVLSRAPFFDGDAHFLRAMTTPGLLTAEDEQILAARIAAGTAAAAALETSADDAGILRARITDGRRARAEFISANLRLVTSMARRYTRRGTPMADLVQEGTIGLTRAVDKFDASLGVRFAAYATMWIRQALVAAVDADQVVHRPAEVQAALRKVYAVAARLVGEGRPATAETIAAETDMTAAEVRRLWALDRAEVSLDVPVGAEETGTLGDLLADESSTLGFDGVDQDVDQPLLRDALDEILAGLSSREATVVRARFGLDGDRPLTLEETAALLGVDRVAVRRLEAAALGALRAPRVHEALATYR
jgi:RNA polymerase primary sigma factor